MTQEALVKQGDRPGQLAEVRQGNFGGLRRQTMAELKELAEAFHAAGYFPDVKNWAQAFVKIKAGEELGFEPFVSMGGIHIIQGKASLGATLQASLIKNSNRYRYETRELSGEKCTLEFFEKVSGQWKSIGTSSFSMSDAKAAGLTKEKDRGMYEKYGRNMLFSRALTNGMRWYTPDLLRSADGNVEVMDNFDADALAAETAEPDVQQADAVEHHVEPVVEDLPQPEYTEDSQLEDLRQAVKDKINELSGGSVEKIQKLLNGRVVATMNRDALAKYLTWLNDEPPF